MTLTYVAILWLLTISLTAIASWLLFGWGFGHRPRFGMVLVATIVWCIVAVPVGFVVLWTTYPQLTTGPLANLSDPASIDRLWSAGVRGLAGSLLLGGCFQLMLRRGETAVLNFAPRFLVAAGALSISELFVNWVAMRGAFAFAIFG